MIHFQILLASSLKAYWTISTKLATMFLAGNQLNVTMSTPVTVTGQDTDDPKNIPFSLILAREKNRYRIFAKGAKKVSDGSTN